MLRLTVRIADGDIWRRKVLLSPLCEWGGGWTRQALLPLLSLTKPFPSLPYICLPYLLPHTPWAADTSPLSP